MILRAHFSSDLINQGFLNNTEFEFLFKWNAPQGNAKRYFKNVSDNFLLKFGTVAQMKWLKSFVLKTL